MQSIFQSSSEVMSPSRGACVDQANRSLEALAVIDREMPLEWFVVRSRHLHPQPPVDPAAGVHRALEALSPRRSPELDPWWQSVPGALAWIVGLLIEGFAAYGASVHPAFRAPRREHHQVPRTD
jgi:hypothetical protein